MDAHKRRLYATASRLSLKLHQITQDRLQRGRAQGIAMCTTVDRLVRFGMVIEGDMTVDEGIQEHEERLWSRFVEAARELV